MKYRTIPFKQYLPLLLIVIAVIAAIGAYYFWRQAEVGSRLFVAPSSQVVKEGGEVSFNIRVASDVPIDTVTASIKYDTNLLRYKQVTYGGSPFDSQIPAISKNTGTVTVQVAKFGGETIAGDVVVATVVFTGTSNGSTKPTLTDGNAAHAGTATNPRITNKLPLTSLLLSISAGTLLLAAAFILFRHKRVMKGKSS